MHRPTLALFSVLLFALRAQAMPWPKDYVVEEETKSPGGWYAVIVPSRETAPDDEEENVDYLANLKTHQVVGKIENAHYSEGRGHFPLSTCRSCTERCLQGAALLLPSARFAKVKAEQVAWLAKFEAGNPSTVDRVAALRTRVGELRDLLWQEAPRGHY